MHDIWLERKAACCIAPGACPRTVDFKTRGA